MDGQPQSHRKQQESDVIRHVPEKGPGAGAGDRVEAENVEAGGG